MSSRRHSTISPRGSIPTVDAVMIGGGVMSATYALLLSELQPDWEIRVFERLARPALESTDPWNNAGTGHAGLAELNYTVEKPDGTVDTTKADKINEQFQLSRQLWATLKTTGVLHDANFINPTPHMTFVTGEDNVAFLRRRWDALHRNTLFASMEFSDDPDQIEAWAPLLIRGRDRGERIAATHDVTGTDVNFGLLTTQLFDHLNSRGVQLLTSHEVVHLHKESDGTWLVGVIDTATDRATPVKARHVFVGAGGYALNLLRMAGLPEVRGYALFPVSGAFLNTDAAEVVDQHKAKVYGKASVGAPPMSVPHLDARVIGDQRVVLFGPFAGTSPKYLKHGSVLDLPRTIRVDNLKPMINVGLDNLDLVKYLVTQVLMPPKRKAEELKSFYPDADMAEWEMVAAGQRAQIIKPDAKGHGILQFGTEAIVSSDRTMTAVLGASPGASVSVSIILDILERAFPDRIAGWKSRLSELIPYYGTTLTDKPELAREVMTSNAEVLGITPPVA